MASDETRMGPTAGARTCPRAWAGPTRRAGIALVLPVLLLSAALLPVSGAAQDAGDADLFATAPELPPETPSDIRHQIATAATVTTLPEALGRTYWTNPPLLAQRAANRAVDWRLPQARANFGPRLSAIGTYGWQRDNFEIAEGRFVEQKGWASTAQAILSQPLFSFGRNTAAERFALVQQDFQRAQLAATEQQAMLDAITAFTAVLRDRAEVGIAGDNLALLEMELADNRHRLNAREVTVTDVQQVETRVELGRAQLLSARRAAAGSEALFLRVVGALPGAIAAPNPLDLPVRTLEDAYVYAEAHNPVLFAARAREGISRMQVTVAKAETRPRVDLRGSALYGTMTPYSSALRQSSLRGEIQLSAPLFESGQRSARLAELEAANDADWRLLDAAFRDNRAAIADAWSEWQAQVQAVGRLAAAVESARKAYDGALLQERGGMRTTLDVLDLARELLLARTGSNAALAGVTIAKARLLFAMGALDYGWLLPDAARYDAEGHLRQVRGKGDVPLLTPLARALDGLAAGPPAPRPLRDPAARITSPGLASADPFASE